MHPFFRLLSSVFHTRLPISLSALAMLCSAWTYASSPSPSGLWLAGYVTEGGKSGLTSIAIVRCVDGLHGAVEDWPVVLHFKVVAQTPSEISGTIHPEGDDVQVGEWASFTLENTRFLAVAVSFSPDPVGMIGVISPATAWFHYYRPGCDPLELTP